MTAPVHGSTPRAALPPSCGHCCRYRSALHVCQRWHRLVNTPQLLASTLFNVEARGDKALAQLQSLFHWMQAHGGREHVHRLTLKLLHDVDRPRSGINVATTCVITACAPALVELNLVTVTYFDGNRWLPALTRLRRLSIRTDGGLPLSVCLDGLTALEELTLKGAAVVIGIWATLPPAITKLA